ncbi:MAG: fumarate hydratase [Candidatus Omnitrophica bacterium CG11_big_fil_rev_8_21_14_0_20_42_13]|uniref:Fumarate hydratase n=1 Tax=Candidatus Ghiorseimicrobium undicola TaxID=1974746 RepID=A0A2H0LZ69_9BACT|nr:MAG: fumarate hydratase [Candidatus Omnitrophica bacterium CG11_big_fil_rev_8_21_14_0_20_42_13]
MKNIVLPLSSEDIKKLKAGDEVLLRGRIYLARDQAHKRLTDAIKNNKKIPFDLRNAAIYYCGPTPAKKGGIIGSCGPTTSRRMDDFTPLLLKKGVSAMIGKGNRSKQVVTAIKKYKAVYFITLAGCGALLSTFIKQRALVAYPELGPEAVQKIDVKDFPAIVAIDSRGKNIYPVRDNS